MPSKASHLAAARRNQRTIDYLLADPSDDHLAWIVAIAFYKALHIVKAVLHENPVHGVKHTDDHKSRTKLLKTTPKFRHIYDHYRPLQDASLIAHYLRESEATPTYDVFSVYMNRDKVVKIVLGHFLHQIQKSAGKLLNDLSFLDDPPSSPAEAKS